MSPGIPTFRDADESGEAVYQIGVLRQATAALAAIRSDPLFAGYLLRAAESDVPLLPPKNELDAAREIIDRTLACLCHIYDQRRRFDDEPSTALDDNPF